MINEEEKPLRGFLKECDLGRRRHQQLMKMVAWRSQEFCSAAAAVVVVQKTFEVV